MLLLTLQVSWLEIIVLQIGALILGCTLYFFYTSRRALDQALRGADQRQSRPRRSLLERFAMRNEVLGQTPVARPSQVAWPEPLAAVDTAVAPRHPGGQRAGNLSLQTLLQRVEQLEAQTGARPSLEIHRRIEELEAALAEKDAALKQARQRETIALQMTERMDEVYRDFERLQQQMEALEARAAEAGETALELEALQRAHSLLQEDLLLKQDKLEELSQENQRLQSELAAASGKLNVAEQQRQQLSARSRLMHDMQSDLDSVSAGQSKLQQQLRRIGELEMMLEQFAEKK